MNKASLFLMSALFSQSLLASPIVDAFLADPVTVLDDQGRLQREVARNGLPQTLPVLQYNKELDLVQVELAGQKVWLDTMDVRVSPPLNVVKLPCQKLSSSQADDHQNNSTIGFGSGCSK
ncbi:MULTISPECIES: hypothetical protein [Pseudomonas]|uniref:hypothetical protein n=1 Tax=Pseudomonas TaxID=286 RepID=UPI0018ABEBB0|nr:hypothetical protein [Pseudomonas guariconensis]MBF8740403.1 hypothetical protein [Pseudomonas guariconensis]MBF8749717.1 hypothetical protein [Pseudomonas guariconensis]